MAPRSRSLQSQSWASFAESLRKQSLMDEMMVVQHVDLIAAIRAGPGFVRARASCRNCACDGACQGSRTEADFCPNLDFFASLEGGDDQA